jgi:uncharacterized protein YjiS (DUF1127 family)
MKTINTIDTDSFAMTGAAVAPANTQMTMVDFPSDLKVMRMVAESRAARNRYIAALVTKAVKSVIGTVAGWHRKHATRQALAGLDNRLLRDIGLERADLEAQAIVAEPGIISRWASSVATTVRNWNAARQTHSTLLRLSDAQLADIGLSRHDVEVLVGEIRGGRIDHPARVQTAAASAEDRPVAKRVKPVMPVNSNHVSSWLMSPRRVA